MLGADITLRTMRDFLKFCQGSLPVHSVDAGTEILREGDSEGGLYILLDGSAEVLKGDVRVNLVTEPGSFFGEMSVLLDSPHTATVKALEPSRFYVAENAREFLDTRPEITLPIATLLAQRLHALTTYLADLKHQFEDQEDHLSMVDEVLESLSHAQTRRHKPGSERDPDPTVY